MARTVFTKGLVFGGSGSAYADEEALDLRREIRALPGGDYGFPNNPIGRNARDLELSSTSWATARSTRPRPWHEGPEEPARPDRCVRSG